MATNGHAKSSSVEQPGAATYIEHPEDGGRAFGVVGTAMIAEPSDISISSKSNFSFVQRRVISLSYLR